MSSKLDQEQIFKQAANDLDKTIATSGFLNAEIGNKVTRVSVSSVIDDFSYYRNGTLLYTLRITWTTSAKSEFDSAERIA